MAFLPLPRLPCFLPLSARRVPRARAARRMQLTFGRKNLPKGILGPWEKSSRPKNFGGAEGFSSAPELYEATRLRRRGKGGRLAASRWWWRQHYMGDAGCKTLRAPPTRPSRPLRTGRMGLAVAPVPGSASDGRASRPVIQCVRNRRNRSRSETADLARRIARALRAHIHHIKHILTRSSHPPIEADDDTVTAVTTRHNLASPRGNCE
jgi:hypothetical protein